MRKTLKQKDSSLHVAEKVKEAQQTRFSGWEGVGAGIFSKDAIIGPDAIILGSSVRAQGECKGQ